MLFISKSFTNNDYRVAYWYNAAFYFSYLLILDKNSLLPVKIYDIRDTNNVFSLRTEFYKDNYKLLLNYHDRSVIATFDKYFNVSVNNFVIDVQMTNMTTKLLNYITDNKSISYLNLMIAPFTDSIDQTSISEIIKTNPELEGMECNYFNMLHPGKFNTKSAVAQHESNIAIDIDYPVDALKVVPYTANGNMSGEVHSSNATLNVKFIPGLELFHDIDGLVGYSELDITSWVWLNYQPEVFTCSPNMPTFVLDADYTLAVGAYVTAEYKFVPFEHCQHSRFLFRLWLNKPDPGQDCQVPPWVAVNESEASFRILHHEQITSADSYELHFQSQLITFSVDPELGSKHVSDFAQVVFTFTNTNSVLQSSVSGWYLVAEDPKTFTLTFSDLENDKTLLRVTDSGGLGVFIQTVNNNAFNLVLRANEHPVSSTVIELEYTDKCHTASQYWTKLRVDVALLSSEPPVFAGQLQSLTVNQWSSKPAVYELPPIVDANSSVFNVTLDEAASKWIQVTTVNAEDPTQASKIVLLVS